MQCKIVTQRWNRIGPLAVLVGALHVALLATPLRSARVHGSAATATRVQVRMLPTAAVAIPKPMTVATLSPQVNDALPLPARAAVASLPAPEPAAKSDPMPETLTHDASPPLPLLGVVLPGVDADGDYYPRSMLSMAPRPVHMVMIDYPAIDQDAGHYRSELTLFIDERGQVARVRVESDDLPPALAAAARSAFLNAKFVAGEAEGRAVKARIRIEVVFDSRPVGA